MEAECEIQIDTNAGANLKSGNELRKRDNKFELK